MVQFALLLWTIAMSVINQMWNLIMLRRQIQAITLQPTWTCKDLHLPHTYIYIYIYGIVDGLHQVHHGIEQRSRAHTCSYLSQEQHKTQMMALIWLITAYGVRVEFNTKTLWVMQHPFMNIAKLPATIMTKLLTHMVMIVKLRVWYTVGHPFAV